MRAAPGRPSREFAGLVVLTIAANFMLAAALALFDVGGLGKLVMGDDRISTAVVFLMGAQLTFLPAFALALLCRHCCDD